MTQSPRIAVNTNDNYSHHSIPHGTCPTPRSGGTRGPASALDVRLRAVVAFGDFVVPMTLIIFIRDRCRFAGGQLLPSSPLRGFAGGVMRREGFRIGPVGAIRPTTVVLNNLISHFRHLPSAPGKTQP